MKKFYYSLLALTALVSTLVVSCTTDNTDPNGAGSVTVVSNEAASTSASFSINTTSATSFAYIIHEGSLGSETNPLVIFADAEETVEIESDSFDYTVYGLEGNTTYTIEFAFKLSNGEYVVSAQEVTTADYGDKRIHIISAEYNAVKFQIIMPDDVKYRYALVDRSYYELAKVQYGYNDIKYLQSANKAEGSKLVSYVDGQVTGQDSDGENIILNVKPAMSFVVLVVECDEKYDPLYEITAEPASETTTRVAEPNVGDYFDQTSDEGISMTGIFAKQYFTTRDPLPAEGDVGVSISTTERTATITLTPTREVLRMGYSVVDSGPFDEVESLVGADGVITAIQPDMESATTAVEFQTPIQLGADYELVVIYISDEAELTRTTKIIPFTATASTNQPVEIEVTGVESNNPYEVYFNIKAPNKDCNRIAMAVDYSRIVIPEVNGMGGATQEENFTNLVLNYGIEYTEAMNKSMFDAINSDAGYTHYFTSFEDTESMLVVLSFNEDEMTYLSRATSKSGVEPAKEPLTTDFFENIDGYWTANYTFLTGWDADEEENYHSTPFTMYITDDPTFGAPETFDSSHPNYSQIYNYYVGRGIQLGKDEAAAKEYAANQIEADFTAFKKAGAHFQQKYKDQNRKVVFGFELDPAANTEVRNHSPWDLFCDLNHSTYDVDQIFYEYGPKIFIEVVEGEDGEPTIEVINDGSVVAPFFSYYGWEYSLDAMSATAWLDYPDYYTEPTGVVASDIGFPFIIKDADTFKFDAYTYNERSDYYPSVMYDMYGMLDCEAIGKSPITVTRDASAQLAPVGVTPINPNKVIPMNIGNKHKRMRISY